MLLFPDLDTATNLAPRMLPSLPIINSSIFPNRYCFLGVRLCDILRQCHQQLTFH